MRNKFLVFLSVVVSLFIIFCFAVIIMVQYPGLKFEINSFLKDKFGITGIFPSFENETEKNNDVEVDVPYVEEKESINYYVGNYIEADGNIDIKYPVITGVEDEERLSQINKKIYDNAISIVKTYPISISNQKLVIDSTVNYLDDYKIVILYEGIVSSIKNSTTKKSTNMNTNKSNSTSGSNIKSSGGGGLYTGSSKYSDNPSNNYQIPGAVYQENFSIGSQIGMQDGITIAPETQYVPQTVSQFDNLPIQNSNPSVNVINPDGSIPLSPSYSGGPPISNIYGMNDSVVFPLASTLASNEDRIFYTNTIDLSSCFDISLPLYQKSNEIAKYMRSNDCEIAVKFIDDEKEIKKYIRNNSESKLVNMLNSADFQNNNLSKWPECFSYELDGYLYIAIKLNKKLGNYTIIRYQNN